MSRIRSIPVSKRKVLIGEYSIELETEKKARTLLLEKYPNLIIVTTPDGKTQIPLQDLVQLDNKFREDVNQTYSRGYEEGLKAGHKTGLDEGLEESRRVVASLSGVVADITDQRHQILAEAKNKVLQLILKISQRLTFTAAEIDPEITMSIISGTIEQLLDKRNIKVKVHPDHLAKIEQHIDKFMGNNTSIKEFAIEADSRIRAGGCFIETPSGDIDARLESMYDIIKQSIIGSEDEAECG